MDKLETSSAIELVHGGLLNTNLEIIHKDTLTLNISLILYIIIFHTGQFGFSYAPFLHAICSSLFYCDLTPL